MPRVKTLAIHGPCGTLVSQPFSRALARLGGMWMGWCLGQDMSMYHSSRL